MLVRLFIVVLTLVGPMPFRICTCAATQTLDNESSACQGIQDEVRQIVLGGGIVQALHAAPLLN